MKNIITLITVSLFMLLLAGCSGSDTGALPTAENQSVQNTETDASDGIIAADTGATIPDEIQEIPGEYFSPAAEKGTLEELYYDTYESFSYEEGNRTLTKRAVVYLPHGYSEDQRYNVFYLMHGGWSNETSTLGTPGHETGFKNVLDNAIQNGEIEPLIVVCPTYNNTNENGQDSDSFSLAMQLTRQYHNELVNDLIPAIEGKYSTFANGVAPEELVASRDHRGFGGFSMGSVTTWRTFEYCMEYFRYYLPMSCGTSLDDEEIWTGVDGHDSLDYFVWIMTGTNDFAFSYDESRAGRMRNSEYFIESSNEQDGNFAYRVKDGYSHDGAAAMEYTYNGMRFFWSNNKSEGATPDTSDVSAQGEYTIDTNISDVINDPAFDNFGRLIFPVETEYYSGDTLGELRLTWYSNIQPDKTVEIANYLRSQAAAGETVFYDIYTDEEKATDPDKRDTGLFFFKGNPACNGV